MASNRFTDLLRTLAEPHRNDPEALRALERELALAYDRAPATLATLETTPRNIAQWPGEFYRALKNHAPRHPMLHPSAQLSEQFKAWCLNVNIPCEALDAAVREVTEQGGIYHAANSPVVACLSDYARYRTPPQWFWDWWSKVYEDLRDGAQSSSEWEEACRFLSIRLASVTATPDTFMHYIKTFPPYSYTARGVIEFIFAHPLCPRNFIERLLDEIPSRITIFYSVDPDRAFRYTSAKTITWALFHPNGWGLDLSDFLSRRLPILSAQEATTLFRELTTSDLARLSENVWPLLKKPFSLLETSEQAKLLASSPILTRHLWSAVAPKGHTR